MTEIRPVPQAAFDLARREEETHLFAYDDKHYPPKPAQPGDRIDGTLTAGTGHTGPDVYIGMVVTDEMNEAWLVSDFATAARRATKKIGQAVVDQLTSNQWAAICDFVFCLGTDTPGKPEWTIWKRLRARQFDQVPIEMQRFVNWGKPPVKSAGLVRRRNAEVELWALGEPGTVDHTPPASATRSTQTPPTPSAPGRSKALIASCVAGAASAPPMIDNVIDRLQKYAEHSHSVDIMLSMLGTAGAICAAIGIYYTWRTARNARN